MPNRMYCERPGCEGLEPVATGLAGPSWRPGSLRADQLEALLVAALSDLWTDGLAYRLAFEERVERSIKRAVGRKAELRIHTEERSQRCE